MKSSQTTALVDGLLKTALLGGVITAGIAAPNSIQILNKPVNKALNKFDKRAYQREIQKTLRYMKSQGLLAGDYAHGLQITAKGRRRLEAAENNIDNVVLSIPEKWDAQWRMLLYDIPEAHKVSRNAFTLKLRELGFIQLQKSVWVYPHECREEILKISHLLRIDTYITYIVCSHIDNQKVLVDKFKKQGTM